MANGDKYHDRLINYNSTHLFFLGSLLGIFVEVLMLHAHSVAELGSNFHDEDDIQLHQLHTHRTTIQHYVFS